MNINTIKVKQELKEDQNQGEEEVCTDEIKFKNTKILEALYIKHDVTEDLVVGPTSIIGPNGQAILYDATNEKSSSLKRIFCKLCDQAFALNVALNAHKKKCHATYQVKSETKEGKENKIPTSENKVKRIKKLRDKGSFTCTICRKHFELNVAFNVHRKKCHDTDSAKSEMQKPNNNMISTKAFSCNFCCKTFTLKGNLIRHQNIYHCQENSQFVCNDCGKKFIRRDYLTRHMRVCSKSINLSLPKNSECVCGKIIKDPSVLHRHKKLYCDVLAPKLPVTCDCCNKVFTNIFFLERHKKLRRVGPRKAKSRGKFTCDYCKKSYFEKRGLSDHIVKLHMKLNKNKCNLCNKSYSAKRSLRKHQNIEHYGKSYSCTFCDRVFRSSWALKLHVKRVFKSNSL